MEILSVVNKTIIHLSKNRNIKKIEEGLSDIRQLVTSIEDPRAIWKAIRADTGDIIPFREKKLMYDKLVELGGKPDYYRDYGYWLRLNGGPDWDDRAAQLLRKAKEYESNGD